MKNDWDYILPHLVRLETTQAGDLTVNHYFIRDFARLINQHYANPELTLESISDALGISTRSVQRKLIQHLDMSFRQYINEVRFFHARDLLAQGYGIGYTATAVGFNSASYFSASFKRRHQQTPKQWQCVAQSKAQVLTTRH